MDSEVELKSISARLAELCSHISVRQDEAGFYIFALGLKGIHTLQLRRINEQYAIQFWHGPDAESESIIGEPSFTTIEAAFDAAKQWLQRDAA